MLYFIATELDWKASWIELTHEDNNRTMKALIDRGYLRLENEDQELGDICMAQLTEAGLDAACSLDISKHPKIKIYNS